MPLAREFEPVRAFPGYVFTVEAQKQESNAIDLGGHTGAFALILGLQWSGIFTFKTSVDGVTFGNAQADVAGQLLYIARALGMYAFDTRFLPSFRWIRITSNNLRAVDRLGYLYTRAFVRVERNV